MCSVGKATKIFIFILCSGDDCPGFGLEILTPWGHHSAPKTADGCHPVLPLPTTSLPPTTPLMAAPSYSPRSITTWQTSGPVHS